MHIRQRLSRRTLLSASVAGLAAPWVLRGAHAAATQGISESAWAELGRRVTGGVFRHNDARHNDPRFLALTKPENLRYFNPPDRPDGPPDPDAPLAAVQPHGAKEVAAAILWARDNNCPMAPRSGGHSYAGCSTMPGGLVIHGGAMRGVRYQPDWGLLEIGGGALNGDIFDTLKTGNRTIVHGRCPAVGISAYLMGGGIGLGMREYGVGCDLVHSVELVLANGSIVRASASNEYKDLFWAVRGGGGGNLGYATRWWLRTVPADKLVAFNVTWRNGTPDIFKRLARALETSPEQTGAQMSITATKVNSPALNQITLIGQYHGPMVKLDGLLGKAFTDANEQEVLELPYWQAQEFFDLGAVPNRYQETSLFAESVSDALIDEAFARMRTLPDTDARARARLTFFLTGGRINKVAQDDTAFVHRSSQWLINPILDWPERNGNTGEHLVWQRDLHNTIAAMPGIKGSYQNFPDPELLDRHAPAYWGANLARLSKVKHAVDPGGVFTPPRHQDIPQTA